MDAPPVLVDSSWYIQEMREGRNPFQGLARISPFRDLVTCGIVRGEVGRGIRDPGRLEKFEARWTLMREVPMDSDLWRAGMRLAWVLDRRGIVLPLADILIAACALRVGAVILTLDDHFSLIPGIVATRRVV